VTIGLDGFVDEIIRVVDKRESADKFTRVPMLAAFAERIAKAAGQSSNAELVVERVKLGGNGPIMANALAAFGTRVTYIGNIGYPTVHPAFAEFAKRATVFSVAEPGRTDALEFDDGKLMLGKHASLRDVTWANLLERVGRDKLTEAFTRASLVGLQNWTMLPHMSDIWQHVLDELCPQLTARCTFFFDLADPEKRERKDIRRALELVAKFQKHFDTYLGLNEKESFEIGEVLGYKGGHDGEVAIKSVAQFIWEKLKVSGVIVHPRAYAVTAGERGVVKVDGPFAPKPLISTGAGDHFNAGFCLGKLIGADNEIALQFGVGASGYYVRTAKSPSANDLAEFLQSL
jgi:sugar/nucleoside kinase (ribokinase family)